MSFWDERYTEKPDAFGHEPNAHLAAVADRFPEGGTILLLGEGYGRNALWLARRGHPVVMVDGSEVAISLAREAAAAEGLPVEAVHADLANYTPPPCDGLVAICCHLPPALRAEVHARAFGALRPGGRFVLEAFTPAQLGRGTGGPDNAELLFGADALRRELPGAEFEQLEELEVHHDEGEYHAGEVAVVRMVARKPAGEDGGEWPWGCPR